MFKSDVKTKLIEAIESVGVNVSPYPDSDIDLVSILDGSLQFLSMIISIEEAFQITIPDEFLIIDNFHSLDGFACMIEELVLSEGDNDL